MWTRVKKINSNDFITRREWWALWQDLPNGISKKSSPYDGAYLSDFMLTNKSDVDRLKTKTVVWAPKDNSSSLLHKVPLKLQLLMRDWNKVSVRFKIIHCLNLKNNNNNNRLSYTVLSTKIPKIINFSWTLNNARLKEMVLNRPHRPIVPDVYLREWTGHNIDNILGTIEKFRNFFVKNLVIFLWLNHAMTIENQKRY